MAAVRPRLHDQDAVLGLVAGEVGVLHGRAERVVGVVRARLEVARGDHQPLAGEAGGELRAPFGGAVGLGNRLQIAQLGVGPAGPHVLGEFVGDARVQAVLPLLDRFLRGGFSLLLRDLRRLLVSHVAASSC